MGAAGATRGLQALFQPSSVAVVGASDDPSRIGGRPLHYLKAAGYRGEVYAVNRRRCAVQGIRAYSQIGEIGAPLDMAIVAVPAPQVLDIIGQCGRAGVRSVVVFSAGFAEIGDEGRQRQESLRRLGAEYGCRILGPNCLGLMNVNAGVMATFSAGLESGLPVAGRVGFVSQSGAFGSHCFAAARQRGLGFSYWVTTGNECDVEFGECLSYLAEDPDTDVIVGYIEGCRDGAKLRAGLEAAHQNRKPVVILKVGRSVAGGSAAAAHTAALVGSDSAYDAVFRRHNVHRAQTIAELLDMAQGCAAGLFPENDKLGLITVSGGVGILMADAAEANGLDVAPLPLRAQERLRALWPYAGVANPVDTTAQTINQPELFGQFLETMLSDGGYGAIVAFLAHVGLAAAAAERIRGPLAAARAKFPDRLVVVSMLSTPEIRKEFTDDGCLVIEDPSAAVALVAGLRRLHRAAKAVPPQGGEPGRSLPILSGERALGEHEAKELLRSAGLSVPPERLVHSASEARRAADDLGRPVVLKMATPLARHKTDVGGVLLGLASDEEIEAGFTLLQSRSSGLWPGTEADGVLVVPMITGGVETIIGVHHDETFGPVVMFGLGGVDVEAVKEVTFRMPPLSVTDAQEMISEPRFRERLAGGRSGVPADTEALAEALSLASELAVAWRDSVESLEINPLSVLPSGQGVAVLDALIVPRSAVVP